MPTADVSVTDSAVEITSGLFDTDDGLKAKVSGDPYWRVHITPQGAIKTGDGTAPPADSSGGGRAGFVFVNDGGGVVDLSTSTAASFAVSPASTDPFEIQMPPVSGTLGEPFTLTILKNNAIPASISYTLDGDVITVPVLGGEIDLGPYFGALYPILGFQFFPASFDGGSTYTWAAEPQVPNLAQEVDSGVWDGDPVTLQEAVNRIAAIVGSVTPIP